jgi:hypothetical protein
VKYAITNGSSVLLLVKLDSGSGATIEANAAAEGVKTIDYDRLTLKGSAVYYAMAKDANLSRSTPGSRLQHRPLSSPWPDCWAGTGIRLRLLRASRAARVDDGIITGSQAGCCECRDKESAVISIRINATMLPEGLRSERRP